jgi:hypothetical protein
MRYQNGLIYRVCHLAGRADGGTDGAADSAGN